MSLSSGTRIGPYEILAPLGAGGMGEVYRALDVRLGREVAIKILPPAFRTDPERLARFEREARALASLNHPNIAAIYGIEEQAGVSALVLELVEGNTLAASLRGGPLALATALDFARQICNALEAAHDRGVVHRDLKPANIHVAESGTLKVLDFGLAKAVDENNDPSMSPTMAGATAAGMIVGTAPYMSPEQARSLAVDKRSDIWAFGCVLYEMLTGYAAFRGESVSDILAAVLQSEPDWARLPARTPQAAIRVLRRCLEKQVKLRIRDIADARLDVEEALAAAASPAAAAGTAGARREVEFRRLTDLTGIKESPAISPDGKMLAFVFLIEGTRQICLRMIAGGAPLVITHDGIDHEQPRWAPDSSTLIYYTRSATPGGTGTVWEISALGGAPRRLATSIGGADISRDGRRVAVFQPANGGIELVAVHRDGARRERLAQMPAHLLYANPRWSPDDRAIAFESSGIEFDHHLEVVSLDTGERREMARSEWLKGFAWLPNGSGIVCSSSLSSAVLYPPVFNLRAVERAGTAGDQLTAGDVSYWEPDLQLSSGKLVAIRARSRSDIWRFAVDGSPAENTAAAARITRQTGHVQTPSVSPDGKEIVYLSDHGGHGNLWVARTTGGAARQITFERERGVAVGVPMWSPAGDWIVFILTGAGQTGLWLIRPDGSDLHQLVAQGFSACWSRDGRSVYYTRRVVGSGRHEKISVDGGTPQVVRDEIGAAAVSADEQTIYYAARVRSGQLGRWSGDCELRRVRPGDDTVDVLARVAASRIPVSPLILQFFLSPDEKWLAAPLTDGATTNIWMQPTGGGPMRQVTDFGDRSILIGRSVSWSADGQSLFAAVAETETDIVSFDGLI
jgi:Tol biopolymer transport system component